MKLMYTLKLLIPSAKRFKSWNMIGRMSYVGIVMGMFVGFIQLSIWGVGIYDWTQPAPDTLSAGDKLLIDQNPTKLEMVGVIREPYDNRGDVIALSIRNSSTVTARNVKVVFYNHEGIKSPYFDEVSELQNGNGIQIRAGETEKYIIAFVKDYEMFFNPSSPRDRLIGVSININTENPFEEGAVVCGTSKNSLVPCKYRAVGLSTVVHIKFGSIFGYKYNILTQFYNRFLDGEIEFLPSLIEN
jgi:hypothetical protein